MPRQITQKSFVLRPNRAKAAEQTLLLSMNSLILELMVSRLPKLQSSMTS